LGWTIKRQSSGPRWVMERPDWVDFVFAFHDDEEIGPRMLARIVTPANFSSKIEEPSFVIPRRH